MGDQSNLIENAAASSSFWDLAKPVLAGQVRHVLSGIGLALAAHGALDPGNADAFVNIGAGLVMYLIGAGWSWWQKVGQQRLAADVARFQDLVAKTVVARNKTYTVNTMETLK